ncbi:hypothetical protein [Anaerostipes sp.]|uniref:hypothetical protein n=1 Tax=Anaerostipes sp. TaxID=1872530 RepID=UPI0025B956F5|nr:hypothetical protein [Anaerostipes sp.]MBS7008704.1 hypothetical protein [Anaerostipes sp.]
MSEIFVEEENTVYELDEECLRKKGKLNISEHGHGMMKKQSLEGGNIVIVLLALLCCFR